MRNKLINIFRIVFILILVTLGLLVFFRPAHTETNILKAIFSSTQDNLLVDLSSRFSAKVNVIVESDDPQKAENTSKMFYAQIDKNKMQTSDVNITGILEDLEKYHNNLLSNKTRKLLMNKQFDKVIENSYETLYNPVMPPIGSIDDDPFLLLTDFVMNLSGNTEMPTNFSLIQYNDKYYSLIKLDVSSDLALSPTVLNTEIEKLVNLQKNLSKDGVKVYLTGAPIHSYFASSHSIFEINLICILSTLFVIALIFLYFGSLMPLVPIVLSIGVGIFSGYCVTALIFKDIHILTFVFSTTLIGVCVDYSLHYFVTLKEEKDGNAAISKIFKSLTVSLITTVSAFLILLFANFILLKQISVFTITGLITVYGIVVLFYPIMKDAKMFGCKGGQSLSVKIWQSMQVLKTKFNIANKINLKHLRFCASTVFVIFLFLVIFNVHFDDNIKNMYTPPKNLLNAEKLFTEIMGSNGDTSIFVVKGDNLEDILQKEEQIADKLGDTEYQSLSKYVPSQKRQKSNQYLIKELYKKNLNDFAIFLPPAKRVQLLNQNMSDKFLTVNKDFEFMKNNFLIDKNTSMMLVSDYSGKNIDGVKIINFQKDISSQIRHCRKVCLELLIPIFGLLYILLAKIYDKKSGLIILLPSICSVIFVFGMLVIFGCPINLFHLLAIFLIIGFGLDYSVFRFTNPEKSGDSVFLSCITTVFSFVLLAFAGFKLISSLGTVLALGLLSSYIFSLKLIKKDIIKGKNEI